MKLSDFLAATIAIIGAVVLLILVLVPSVILDAWVLTKL